MTSKVMKLEAALRPDGNAGTDEVVRQARELEALGFDRIFTAETSRNPFFPLCSRQRIQRVSSWALGLWWHLREAR